MMNSVRSAARWILWACLLPAGVAMAQENSPVIFSEDFESGTLDKWDDDSIKQDPKRLALVRDASEVFRGKVSVKITALPGEGTGGKLNKWFLPGYDRVYARFYCKFAEDFDQGNHMHFVHLLANRWDNKWSAFGKAGLRPAGNDFFTTGLEPWRDWGRNPPPGAWMLYTYHMDMPIDSKMGKYWGEMMRPEVKAPAERGRWICMEFMIKANTPGQADGEEAFWIDGKPAARFTGIRWRTDARLQVNDFWLMLYVHQCTQVNRVWFDDVVISREYIGPIKD